MVCQEWECFLMYGVICCIGSQLSHYCFWQTLIQTDRALRKKVPGIKSKRILTGHCTLCADHLTDLNICYSFFSIRDTERPFHQNRGIKNYHLKVLLYCLLLNYINLNKDHLHHEIPSFFSSLLYIRYNYIKIGCRLQTTPSPHPPVWWAVHMWFVHSGLL